MVARLREPVRSLSPILSAWLVFPAFHAADPERQLMFAGHNAFRFASDPFYANGFVPTVAQLVARLQTGA